MLKVRTLFSGVGSPESALKNLGVEFELVDFCEVDVDATISYGAIHLPNFFDENFEYPSKLEMQKWLIDRGIGWDFQKQKSRILGLNLPVLQNAYKSSVLGGNLGDISKVQEKNLSYADMLVWGFPCTDISVAGKQKGIVEGETRSGLYYEGLRILKETKPKYSIIENVKNLTGKQFKEQFKQMLEDIDDIGYNNYWQVLNAKNYGIPQKRERVFIVSVRKDIDTGFEFPTEFDNGLRLKDMLESNVDEKYYLTDEHIGKILNWNAQQKPFARVNGKNSICPTLTARGAGENHSGMITYSEELDDTTNMEECLKLYIREATKRGYAIAEEGDSINIAFPNSQTRRGRVQKECAGTLQTSVNQATIINQHGVRLLTPRESFRLMGFSDEEFDRAAKVNKDRQLYKQAGNSIVTKVMYYIFKNLLPECKGE